MTPSKLGRAEGMAMVRMAFGVVWAIDAWFKWQPSFIQDFTDYVAGAAEGQPAAVQAWIHLWHDVVQVDPRLFAYAVAIGETAIAVGLLLGAFSNLTYAMGIALSTVIWSTAEGFGGPYVPGSVDVGSAIIYVLVFAALFFGSAGRTWGLDTWLAPRLGRFAAFASGRTRPREGFRA